MLYGSPSVAARDEAGVRRVQSFRVHEQHGARTSLHVSNTCQDNIADLAYRSTFSSFTIHDGNRLEPYTLTP